MPESRRLIAFNQEMTGPGATIAHNRPGQRVQRMPEDEGRRDDCQAQQSSHGVQDAIAAVTVLSQVMDKEFLVSGKLLLLGQSALRGRNYCVVQKMNVVLKRITASSLK